MASVSTVEKCMYVCDLESLFKVAEGQSGKESGNVTGKYEDNMLFCKVTISNFLLICLFVQNGILKNTKCRAVSLRRLYFSF